MIKIEAINSWTLEYGELPASMQVIFKKRYNQEFVKWVKESDWETDELGSDTLDHEYDDLWDEFFLDTCGNLGTIEVYEQILKAYIQEHELKAVYFDITNVPSAVNEDAYQLVIYQVQPRNLEELQEVIEVYCEKQNIQLSEMVTDTLIDHIKECQ